MTTAWFCDAHQLTTTSDCPKCDDELIALSETTSTTHRRCHTCGRQLHEGESVWASDWTVIDDSGARTETRYTCDTCDNGGAA